MSTYCVLCNWIWNFFSCFHIWRFLFIAPNKSIRQILISVLGILTLMGKTDFHLLFCKKELFNNQHVEMSKNILLYFCFHHQSVFFLLSNWFSSLMVPLLQNWNNTNELKNKLRIFLFFLPVEFIFFSGEEQVRNFNTGNMKNICLKLFRNSTKHLNRCHIKKQ